MIKWVDEGDLEIINKSLNNGADVRIQLTRDGCRIVEDNIRVISKKTVKQ